MRPIISDLIRNQRFQDIAAIGRGLYRVMDGSRDTFKYQLYDQPLQDKKYPENSQPMQFGTPTLPSIKTTVSKSNQPLIEVPQTPSQPIQTQAKVITQSDNILTEPPPTQLEVESNDLNPPVELEVQKKNNFVENKVPDSSFQRALQFSWIGAKLAGSTMKGVLGGQSWKQAAVSPENASYLARGLCKMRGAPLKLAQALSIQEDKLIPDAIRKAFEQARQNADIMPQKQLNKIMIQELGEDWLTKFDHFDTQPFAAASIGQVHKAIVKGKEVAVKIQYPGVRESIDSDMNNLRRLMNYTNLLPKTMFLDSILLNTKKELYEECDYVEEASKQERYRMMLINDQKDYLVPKVYKELSTERILTAEYMDGEDLDYVAKNYPQDIRNELGRKILSLTLRELFEFRFMQSDPNPSNFYYKKSTGQLILLDFGAAHEYKKEFIDLYIDIIYAAAQVDRALCLKRSEEIGFLNGEESLRMKDAHVDSVLIVGEPFKHDGEFDFGSQKMTERIYELMPIMLRYRLKAPPTEVYSLHRKLSGAYLMNMKLNSKVVCRSMLMNLYNQYKFN